MIYHVSQNGSDRADGSERAPFQTINHAAKLARPGDIVKVHTGTYREWVDPKNGGTSEHYRIVYEAAEGEHPVIKGSEIVTDWENIGGTIWKKVLPNEMFGDWNPYEKAVEGDWMHMPVDYCVHLGDVYINGVSMFEAISKEDLHSGEPRKTALYGASDPIWNPELTVYKWFAEVDDANTTIYCNFQNYNPNDELIEINVRPCCFYPKKTGVNFITLRGFEIAHAACPWIPPTVDQIGMVGPNWSRGWIIENNHLHDAKCSALSLGKEASTGDHLTVFNKKSGHRYQLEAVFAAVHNGWNRDTIGSHIVRNNKIHDCGQNGIVGHLGCIFSKISHNHVYNIGTKREFMGSELGGIKFHAAIDTLIENNNVHDCTLGTWLDWQAQGIRFTGNVYYHNERDLEIEVSHGPCLVDNNLFLSACTFDCYSQGNAFVHNLFVGYISSNTVLNRSTPYHYPHSTAVAGYSEVLGGDDRYYNNLFVGEDPYKSMSIPKEKKWETFPEHFNRYSSEQEYTEEIVKGECGNLGKFLKTPQPIWVDGNGYSGKTRPSRHDHDAVFAEGLTAKIVEEDGVWKLHLNVPAALAEATCKAVTTRHLGETRISALPFEASNGEDFDFSRDMLGNERGDSIIAGPFAKLRAGEQIIEVWKCDSDI